MPIAHRYASNSEMTRYTSMLDATVIILTHRRLEKAAACVGAVAQSLLRGVKIECIVTIDGEEPHTAHTLREIWNVNKLDPGLLTIIQGPRDGPCTARNRAIAIARGDILIFFNDDVVPKKDCIAQHLAAQRTAADTRGAVITGESPWMLRSFDSFFDRMLRDTGMVFFHHTMRGSPDPARNWGFRHAWMLNLSIPAWAVRSLGGLRKVHLTYGRDDDELAYRLNSRLGLAVYYQPLAIAVHDHPMTPDEYLHREYHLGLGAPAFAKACPECSYAMFGRDLLAPQSLLWARERAGNTPGIDELPLWFQSLARLPAPTNITEINDAYDRHLPLKRAAWLRGYEEGLQSLRAVCDAA